MRAGRAAAGPGQPPSPQAVRPPTHGYLAWQAGQRVLAGAGLVLTAPVTVGLAIVIRRAMGTPVLFRQTRSGQDGRPFTLLKFRSMRESRAPDEPDADRITALGAWLRATSLDEIPSLLNVLAGQMLLVGPRPLLPSYDALYSPSQAERLLVRPGITGWTQVNGRNGLSWGVKLEMDRWYVEHRSVALDLRILAATIRAVLDRSGVSHPDHATMPRFTGTEPTDPDPYERESQ